MGLTEVRGRVEEVLPFLAPFGRVVFIGAAEGEMPPVSPVALMRKNLSLFAKAPEAFDRGKVVVLGPE